MSLRIVNTAPGEVTDSIYPGQTVHFGLKSTDLSVVLGTLRTDLAFSGLVHKSLLPEDDSSLSQKGASVIIETPEHSRPVTGTVSRAIVGGNLVFTKVQNLQSDYGVYEIQYPINGQNSIMGYFKFNIRTGWAKFISPWMSLSDVVCPYLGIEHGGFNTGLFAFLRDDGIGGSLVVGGPQQDVLATRPGQAEFHTGWLAYPDMSVVELYLLFNVYVSPACAEIWWKGPTDTYPLLLGTISIASLGIFPNSSSIFSNYRDIPSLKSILYMGNSGHDTDVLQMIDWAIFPDYRVAIKNGHTLPNHIKYVLPDCPVRFDAKEAVKLEELKPGRWIPGVGSPTSSLYYLAGRKISPLYVSIDKQIDGKKFFQKSEPRIETRVDGCMIEGVLGADDLKLDGVAAGCGFGIEDGDKSFRVQIIESGTTRSIGIVKDESLITDLSGYHYPVTLLGDPLPYNYSNRRLMRLAVDRYRDKVLLWIDNPEYPILEKTLSTDIFPSSGTAYGKAILGFLSDLHTKGTLRIEKIMYLPRYLAWEGVDSKLPDDITLPAATKFVLEELNSGGSSSIVDGILTLTKATYNDATSKRYYSKSVDFKEIGGLLLDFRSKIIRSTDVNGTVDPIGKKTGVYLKIYFGEKVLSLGFYDCGSYGRKIGVIPGSGNENDILNQTELGRKFSATCDWRQTVNYRIIFRGFGNIEIWTGSPITKPAITIPWRNDTEGFDLPDDSTLPSLAFGHFDGYYSSVSEWEYMRWGLSDGYEVAVEQLYDSDPQKFHFGGKVFVFSSVEDA